MDKQKMYKDTHTVLADGIDKQKTRRGYYRRMRYFRGELERFSKGFRKIKPERCLKCAYAKCRCGEVAA